MRRKQSNEEDIGFARNQRGKDRRYPSTMMDAPAEPGEAANPRSDVWKQGHHGERRAAERQKS